MKTCSFFVSFTLAIAIVNGFSTEERVKRFFRPEHRALLPDLTSFQIEDENSVARVPQNDDSTQCLAHCEPECQKLDVPDFLTVRKFGFLSCIYWFLRLSKSNRRKLHEIFSLVHRA